MKKNKKKFITVLIIIIVVLIIFFSLKDLNNNNKYVNSTIELCDFIKENKESKKSFVVYIEPQNSSYEITDPTGKLSKEHKELIIKKTNTDKLMEECFKNEIKETGSYDRLSLDEAALIMYKDGEYISTYTSPEDYNTLEAYMIEKGMIKKNEIKEKIDLEGFKNKIKDKFVVFILTDEEQREIVTKNASETMKDIDYEIVDTRSTEGKKIDNYIHKNYTINNNYPKAIYFKNSKIVNDVEIYNLIEDYKEFVKTIE